jgi:hypothetical protein
VQVKLTEEDGVLTAMQARIRAEKKEDDSLIRSELREIMARIREASGYGYSQTVLPSNKRTISPKVNELLAGMCYTVESKETQNYMGCTVYDWVISWGKSE